MNTVSDLPLSWLTLPGPGDRTSAELVGAVRKIALRQLMTFPTARLSAAARRPVQSARRVLTETLRVHPAAMMEAVGHPDVLTPLLIMDVGQELTNQEPEALLRAATPALLIQLAHRARSGAISEAVLWDLPLTEVPDATAWRLLRFTPPASGLVADPLGMEFRLEGGQDVRLPPPPEAIDGVPGLSTERPFHRISADLPRLQLSLYDSNKLSMFEAHPDKDGNAISLGARPVDAWLQALRQAIDLIRVALPTWYEEARVTARRFVPVGYLPERHLSATYREAPGVAYLTLCDNPLTMAEAIVHEIQHTKVNLLSWIDPIMHNAHTCWTQSPVRPDLRPLWGVLLAVHAFVPVAAMHERLAALHHPASEGDRFVRRRLEVLQGNHRGMKIVLENAEPSERGKRFIDEMHRLHDHLRSRAPTPPPGLEIDPDVLPG